MLDLNSRAQIHPLLVQMRFLRKSVCSLQRDTQPFDRILKYYSIITVLHPRVPLLHLGWLSRVNYPWPQNFVCKRNARRSPAEMTQRNGRRTHFNAYSWFPLEINENKSWINQRILNLRPCWTRHCRCAIPDNLFFLAIRWLQGWGLLWARWRRKVGPRRSH